MKYDGKSWDEYLSDKMNELLWELDDDDIDIVDESGEISSAENFVNQERKNYLDVDREFKKFLSNFVINQNKKDTQKRWLKGFFFAIIMVCFFVLMISPILVFYLIVKMSISDTSAIVAIISVLIELISAIIILPKVIAEYLFDKEEDKNMMDLIKNMQDYNEKKHSHFNENT